MTTQPTGRNRPVRRWRWVLLACAIILAALVSRPIVHLLSTASQDADQREPLPSGFVDDASRLNPTQVAEIWPVPSDPAEAEQQLAELLRRARRGNLRVSIAGARHSMGGHTLTPGGIVIDMLPFDDMQLDEARDILHVQAGALWSAVLPYLDAHGRSVAVMQSNNSFSVGGSISVNCHGWQYKRPPIASTVESFRLMTADGNVVRCSRQENAELFSLALGGYGLFGVILDVELRVVPNERYRLEQFVVPVDEALATYEQQIASHPDAAMVYARMSTSPDRFLAEVILNVLHPDPSPDGRLPELAEPGIASLRRAIFRGSAGSDYGKELRWEAETRLQPKLKGSTVSRNQLLNEGVEVFANRSADSTDILHEYFVPPDGISRFVGALQEIIPRHEADLLNVTVRYVDTDTVTFLRYADQPMFALVMLFYQHTTPAADAQMQAMTQEMIEAVLECGGRYYLPYRLHATPRQFRRAYPQADTFFALKRKYDPDLLFQNRFYERYAPTGE